MNEEKIVKINDIEISKSTGFKNLQFETSRYSDGLNTIRGFGDMLNEQNLNIIDTVSIDFVLNYYELRELAYIYCLFKANGILPIENEYLLKKIKSTYEEGKTSEEIKKDIFIKENISHLICFLQRMNITSLEKTNNGYQINMILTLYNNVLTKEEFDGYIKHYNEWLKKTKFDEICYKAIDNYISTLQEKSDIEIKAYNVETLNAVYKEHILSNSTINSKLNSDNEFKNEEKANSKLEKTKELIGNVDISESCKTITIPNHSILQIEMVTENNISNVPIIGRPIGNKSYLGIGSTHFSVKLIFNEWENDTVEQLKKISDKNIINHKIEIDHPLIQLFDFHTSNILNIVFNNLEEANGIMVNIVFALNGFRFSEETTINTDELLDLLIYDNSYKQEEIGGLYLEYVADYLYKNRKILNYESVTKLMTTILESGVQNIDEKSYNYNNVLYTSDCLFIDFLSSYSSFPSSFGTHTVHKDKSLSRHSLFSVGMYKNEDILSDLYNKKIESAELRNINNKDFLLFDYFYDSNMKDSTIKYYRNLSKETGRYYSYIDNISALSLIGNDKYKQEILKFFYSKDFLNSYSYNYIMNDTIKKIVVELFNTKQNLDSEIYRNEVYKKIYEEFFYRLFYNLNINLIEQINSLKNISFMSANEEYIYFDKIYEKISEISDLIYESFINTLYDGTFIERITREVIDDYLKYNEKDSIKNIIYIKIQEAREYVDLFILEFEKEYNSRKEIIKKRMYNIFLTKFNYFLVMRNTLTNSGNDYEDKFHFLFDEPIKIYLLSSAIHGLLLTRTSTRTDHFDNFIILGCKNIGYKISTYNSRLEQKTYYVDKDGKEHKSNVFFYQLFRKEIFKQSDDENKNLYYKNKIKFNDFLYEKENIFNYNPNKDINFFYGSKIDQLMLYKDLINISIPYYYESNLNDMKTKIINSSKKNFAEKPYFNELDINNIDFPMMNFGFIPSHYTELFYDDSSEKKSYIVKDIMKQRIIGNIDPFKNLEEITNIVLENENYIMPDYDICVYKKEPNSEYVGEIFKNLNNRSYMFLKNASSISIVKNPKTKIKTMTVAINNVSKSIFNFDFANGSFDMKTLKNGKVDIIHIEPGDEIRVRVGFDEKIQMFNGFINVIENTGNQLILHCSSFTSLLYNEKIQELSLQAGSESIFDKIKKCYKKLFNSFKYTLDLIDSRQIDIIRKMHNISSPLNNHLFLSLQRKSSKDFISNKANDVFLDGERASMYTAANLALSKLKTVVGEKFIKSKISDITQGKLALEIFINKSLEQSFGSSSLEYEPSNNTYDIYTNINNVDVDYETYGIIKKGSYAFPFSLNSFKHSSYSSNSSTNKTEKENFVYNKKNSNDNPMFSYSFNDSLNYGKISLPVDPSTNIITSLYGERRKNKKGSFRTHNGIDICCNGNSSRNIYPICDGIVTAANYGSSAGYYIKIRHKIPDQDKYFESAYMHLASDSIKVKVGDKITIDEYNPISGKYIGIMGNTGSSSGQHLHFEVYILNNKFEKYMYINPFDSNMLPKHKWEVSWDSVNIMADNGQYTEEWKESYSKSAKTVAYFKNGGR